MGSAQQVCENEASTFTRMSPLPPRTNEPPTRLTTFGAAPGVASGVKRRRVRVSGRLCQSGLPHRSNRHRQAQGGNALASLGSRGFGQVVLGRITADAARAADAERAVRAERASGVSAKECTCSAPATSESRECTAACRRRDRRYTARWRRPGIDPCTGRQSSARRARRTPDRVLLSTGRHNHTLCSSPRTTRSPHLSRSSRPARRRTGSATSESRGCTTDCRCNAARARTPVAVRRATQQPATTLTPARHELSWTPPRRRFVLPSECLPKRKVVSTQ
jgi:hypothetical protein